jgi:acetolactate synthase-1/2/3 large subunit
MKIISGGTFMVLNAAAYLVKCLEAQKVEFIFGIPGASIDGVYNALLDSHIRLIVCRHEQNAVFMAAAYGRLTGKPGVVLVTSGPGVANMATGLLTATTEGDPVVAIGGNVSRSLMLKESHQAASNVALLKSVTKLSVQIGVPEEIGEVVANCFRQAVYPRSGGCFISISQDILRELIDYPVILQQPSIQFGTSFSETLQIVCNAVLDAKFPVLLLGEEASRPDNASAIRGLLEQYPLPAVSTFQAAGVISYNLIRCAVGCVGLFHNQPGDRLLEKADVILAVGFNEVEYDPELWNFDHDKIIIHIDYMPAKIRLCYQPLYELLGNIERNITELAGLLAGSVQKSEGLEHAKPFHDEMIAQSELPVAGHSALIHPRQFIHALRQVVNDSTIVTCDAGSVYMWMARYFTVYNPRQLLFSNGQQTMGVALPWAIAASLACPGKKIISLSGDGGFLFSGMELETAVRENCRIIHCVWRDGGFNMVKEGEMIKYQRKSGVDFGTVNLVDYARAFGAVGYAATSSAELPAIFADALQQDKPVLIDIPIDYSDNHALFVTIHTHKTI